MMEVLVSGEVGAVAVLGRNPQLRRVGSDPISNFPANRISGAFVGAGDVELKHVASVSDADALAKTAWRKDRALRVFLLLLDPSEAEDTDEYAACLEELIADLEVEAFLRQSLCSAALPEFVDIQRVISAVADFPIAARLVESLLKDQSEIRRATEALDEALKGLPVIALGGMSKQSLRKEIEKAGAISELVSTLKAGTKIDFFLLKMLAKLRRVEGARMLIEAWTANMRTSRAALPALKDESEDEKGVEDWAAVGSGGRQAYENAMRQQAAIVARLKDRDIEGARRFADELIASQSLTSSAEHIGKSLSNLSHKAKMLGVTELQIEWAEKAVHENPADPMTYGHLGDALICAARFYEAGTAFDSMEAVGGRFYAEIGRASIERASGKLEEARARYLAAATEFDGHPNFSWALSGAAELLRDMGRNEEALKEYRKLTHEFPFDDGAWTGLASVLMDMGQFEEAILHFGRAVATGQKGTVVVAKNGRATAYKLAGNFEQALKLYDEVLKSFPNDSASLCGRAEVFRARGDLDLALAAYETAAARAPTSPVPMSGMAEVLKELGKFQDAASILATATARFPEVQQLGQSYISILKAQGRYVEALALYDEHIRKNPFDFSAKASRADIFRRLERWTDALKSYDDLLEENPGYASAIAAKAAIFIRLGRFDEAELLLPNELPKSQAQWGRYVLRALLLEEKGEKYESRKMLERGLRSPFARQRRIIKATLARLELDNGFASKALTLVESAPNEISNVIRFHALAAAGRTKPALEAYEHIQRNEPDKYGGLVIEIARRFKLVESPPSESREWIFRMERQALLQEAA